MFQALNVAPPPPIADDEVTQPQVLAARNAEGSDYLKRARYEEGMGRCTKQDVDEAGNYLMGTIVASTVSSIQRVVPNIAAQQIAAILLPQMQVEIQNQMQQLQNQVENRLQLLTEYAHIRHQNGFSTKNADTIQMLPYLPPPEVQGAPPSLPNNPPTTREQLFEMTDNIVTPWLNYYHLAPAAVDVKMKIELLARHLGLMV